MGSRISWNKSALTHRDAFNSVTHSKHAGRGCARPWGCKTNYKCSPPFRSITLEQVSAHCSQGGQAVYTIGELKMSVTFLKGYNRKIKYKG